MTESSVEAALPIEDVGAQTAARYRYQAELAAHHCLALLVDDSIARVICEWHEDYAVIFASGETALVSVKHLEESQPRWTIKQLCDAGGLAHLFDRWRSTGESSSCMLRTNAGLRTGVDQAAGLRDCCHSREDLRVDSWTDRIVTAFRPLVDAEPSADQTRRFLKVLTIDAGLPNKASISAANVVDHVPAVLAALGYNPMSASQVYESIVDEIELASRTVEVVSLLQLVASTLGHQTQIEDDLTLKARTIDKGRLLQAMAGPTTRRSQTRLLEEAPDPAMLTAKLTKGGFGPTAISNARNLRLNWVQHRLQWSTGFLQQDEAFQVTQSEVLYAASRAENATRNPEAAYGVAMQQVLENEIDTADFELPGSVPADPKLILGCAYDLTAACRIWWSDEFELLDDGDAE